MTNVLLLNACVCGVSLIVKTFVHVTSNLYPVLGTASVASGFSGYIDAFAGKSISTALNETMHMDVPGLGPYPDLLAAGLCLLLAGTYYLSYT